jgi:hypothetical protein
MKNINDISTQASSDPLLTFIACPKFIGSIEGLEFRSGNQGLGYYRTHPRKTVIPVAVVVETGAPTGNQTMDRNEANDKDVAPKEEDCCKDPITTCINCPCLIITTLFWGCVECPCACAKGRDRCFEFLCCDEKYQNSSNRCQNAVCKVLATIPTAFLYCTACCCAS